MNAVPQQVAQEALPASRKVYKNGEIHKGLRVPMREITLHPSAGEAPLTVYDSSGPFTDPTVKVDLKAYFDRIAPEDGPYEHDSEGPDDMPAHLKTALTQVQLSIPVVGGRMAFGTWQGVYLFEHRRHPHRREIVLHLMGE